MEIKKAHNLNNLWGSLIVEELIRCGVDYFCIAPGSRSAPLTASVALNTKAKTFVHFDERGLAFHALGYASATRKPVALICTSGTATANFFPAIIEASKKKLPLIVLTADRPPELQKTGSDQVIEQVGIYSTYAKWEFTFPCPTIEIKPEFVLTTIDQAVFQSKSATPGVVHLNCMFREPLAPIGKMQNFGNYTKHLEIWAKLNTPYTKYVHPENLKTFNSLVIKSLADIKNGLIAVGKLNTDKEKEAVLKLAQKLNWPIFADITSGLRLGTNNAQVIHYYDQLLLSEKVKKNFRPDGILHLGGRMCPRRYYHFVAHANPKHYITVLPHSLRNDPLHKVTLRIQSPVADFCAFALENISQRHSNKWLGRLSALNNTMDKKIDQFINKSKTLSEIAVARIISRNISKNSALFLASSMPIRDMDMYASANGFSVAVGSNRGASGIDGTIASAIGFAKALNKPTTLIIGDLAFLHDLNSLAMAKELKQPFVIVVLNNNGGGIFNFLPIAQRKDIFEKYFGTPHNLNFKAVGEIFDASYQAPKSTADFLKMYKNALKNKQTTIIEIHSNRAENLAKHKKLQEILVRS